MPAGSAVDVAWPQGAALDIAKLVEHEQRVVAGAAEMSVVGAVLLLAVGRALARIHVEHDDPGRLLLHLVDPLAGQVGERGKILGPAQPLRLEAPSGWPRRQSRQSLGRRPPSASPGRGTASRRRSPPRSRRAARAPIDAASRPDDGVRSSRCAHRRECPAPISVRPSVSSNSR